MKIIKVIVLAAITFFCSSGLTLADSLGGIANEYNVLSDAKPTKYKPKYHDTTKSLPEVFYSGKKDISFEKTTLTDIKNYLGGNIKKNDSDTWVCYNSKLEGITYWFISFTEMHHGDLSTVILAPLDKKSKCDIPRNSINLKLNTKMPLLHSNREHVFNYFDIKIDKKIPSLIVSKDSAIPDARVVGGYTKTNSVQYLFKKDKIIGIFISQVTTN